MIKFFLFFKGAYIGGCKEQYKAKRGNNLKPAVEEEDVLTHVKQQRALRLHIEVGGVLESRSRGLRMAIRDSRVSRE